jgi:hypothetical protein
MARPNPLAECMIVTTSLTRAKHNTSKIFHTLIQVHKNLGGRYYMKKVVNASTLKKIIYNLLSHNPNCKGTHKLIILIAYET